MMEYASITQDKYTPRKDRLRLIEIKTELERLVHGPRQLVKKSGYEKMVSLEILMSKDPIKDPFKYDLGAHILNEYKGYLHEAQAVLKNPVLKRFNQRK